MADFSKGWVKILRSIQDHPIWKGSKFNKAQAWIDLILTANHKQNKVLIGNEMMIVKSGELITSQRKLAEKWDWSRNTVRAFLRFLEQEQMIALKTTHDLSHLTILNYNGIQQKSTHQVSQSLSHPLSHLLSTNKNDKNDKENISMVATPQKHFYAKYQEKTKEPYVPDYGKDGAIFKHLRATLPDEKIIALIDRFFDSKDEFIERAGWTIGVFKTQVNKLQNSGKSHKKLLPAVAFMRPDPNEQAKVAELVRKTAERMKAK